MSVKESSPSRFSAMLKLLARCVLSGILLATPVWLHAQANCADDAPGRQEYQRIVSVGGAITETLYALRQGHRVVATDTTSYFPEAAKKTPKVGYQRTLSAEGILSTRPDLIVASDQAGPPAVIRQLKASGLTFRTLPTATDLAQVIDNIRALSALLCAVQAGEDLVMALQNERNRLPEMGGPSSQKVLFIMQHGSGAPMVAGAATSAASIIRLSGAMNAAEQFEGYKPLTPEALLAAQPDVILTTNMGLEQAGGLEGILALPGVGLTPAGKQKAIISMDSLLLLGFGPRTIEAATALHQHLKASG